MRTHLFQTLSKFFFLIGLSLSILLAVPGTKGVILSLVSFVIGAVIIVFPVKYQNKKENHHSPLLFDFLMIAAFTAAYFSKEVPCKIYPVFICWQMCFILDVVYWLVDKQYEGKDVKQLISSNVRIPLIVDFLIIVININGLVTGEGIVTPVLSILLIIISLIDACRQLILLIKRGNIEMMDLF